MGLPWKELVDFCAQKYEIFYFFNNLTVYFNNLIKRYISCRSGRYWVDHILSFRRIKGQGGHYIAILWFCSRERDSVRWQDQNCWSERDSDKKYWYYIAAILCGDVDISSAAKNRIGKPIWHWMVLHKLFAACSWVEYSITYSLIWWFLSCLISVFISWSACQSQGTHQPLRETLL